MIYRWYIDDCRWYIDIYIYRDIYRDIYRYRYRYDLMNQISLHTLYSTYTHTYLHSYEDKLWSKVGPTGIGISAGVTPAALAPPGPAWPGKSSGNKEINGSPNSWSKCWRSEMRSGSPKPRNPETFKPGYIWFFWNQVKALARCANTANRCGLRKNTTLKFFFQPKKQHITIYGDLYL